VSECALPAAFISDRKLAFPRACISRIKEIMACLLVYRSYSSSFLTVDKEELFSVAVILLLSLISFKFVHVCNSGQRGKTDTIVQNDCMLECLCVMCYYVVHFSS